MTHVLLLGAGFSRNWGGWLASEAFEYLLGCDQVLQNKDLHDLLWKHESYGGFESALAEVQDMYKRKPSTSKFILDGLQNAILHMFQDMNDGFFSITDFEFQKFKGYSVKEFLARFDAIFTLNQDLLLEHHYNRSAPWDAGQWAGSEMPGMRRLYDAGVSWAESVWTPDPSAFHVNDKFQPYFKLHGSSNWHYQDGGVTAPLLIMGGNKSQEIRLHPVLQWYSDMFERYLSLGDVRLMIIGYGFRDKHINDVIIRAVTNSGLKMFNIAPSGANHAKEVNSTYNSSGIYRRNELEETFERGLIGASRRSLGEIFGPDAVERDKIMRFFA